MEKHKIHKKNKVKVPVKTKNKHKVIKITSNRGQVAVMSGVLLLLVGLFVVYLAYTFFIDTGDSLQDETSDQISAKLIEIRSTFNLEKQDGVSIYMRNTGSYEIEDGSILVYLNGIGIVADIDGNIPAGHTGIMNIMDWDDVVGDPGIEMELVVPGKLISRTIMVKKPNEL